MKSGKFYTSVSRVAIWGNHSTTQVPDFLNSKIGGLPAMNQIKELDWFKNEFTPTVSGSVVFNLSDENALHHFCKPHVQHHQHMS